MAPPLSFQGFTAGNAALGLTMSRMTPVSVSIPSPPTSAFFQFFAGGGIPGTVETNNAWSFSYESGLDFTDLPGTITDQVGAGPGSATAFGITDQYMTTAVIGAAAEDPGSPPTVGTTGVIYVFTESSTAVWSQVAALQGSDTVAGDFFGSSVSIYGGVIAGANNPGSGTVGIYLFTGAGATWGQSQKIVVTAASAGVKLFANYLFVATLDGANTGHVQVWIQQSTGVYVFLQTLSGAGVGDFFGFASAVAMDFDGRTLAVGAIGAGLGGEVFLFRITAGTQFSLFQKITGASNTIAGDQFGSSVSISQNLLGIGANRHATNGAVYAFLSSGTAYLQVQYIPSPNAAGTSANDFGNSVLVAIFGTVTFLIVGAPFYDSGANNSGGAVYFYAAAAGFGGDPYVTFAFKGMKIYGGASL